MITLLTRLLSVTHRRRIAGLLLAAVACVLGGGALFSATQHLPVTTGLYWAVTTATTVGYGDVTPHNGAGRLVAALVMLTTIPVLAAVFALATGGAAAAGLRRVLAMQDRFPEGAYRLLIGMSRSVPAILDELAAAGVPVVLVADVEPSAVPRGVHLVRGDPAQPAVIRAARPQGAQQALITGAADGDVLVSAVVLRNQAPGLPVTALVGSAAVREALHELGVRQALSADELLARTLAMSLETPHAADLLTKLVSPNQHRLAEIEAGAGVVGKPLSAVREERAGLVLGLVREGGVTLGIGEDPVIAPGDRLVVAEAAEPRHG